MAGQAIRTTARSSPKSRYERQQRYAAPGDVSEETLYSGYGRARGPSRDRYRITTVEVEVVWAPGMYANVRDSPRRVHKLSDVRRISSQVDLWGGVCDLQLELFWGTRVWLEQLPAHVAEQIQRIVKAVEAQYLARRATMLYRCVRSTAGNQEKACSCHCIAAFCSRKSRAASP